MIYEYYESKKSTRKTVPIENIIENFMSEIKNHLEQKNFTQAYNMINRMRWTIKQKTNSEELIKKQLNQVEAWLKETLDQLIEKEDFENITIFLEVFGRFFNITEESTLVLPSQLSSSERMRQNVLNYILDFMENSFSDYGTFQELISNFDRLGLVDKNVLINSPELKERAMKFLANFLEDIKEQIERVVEEIKIIEKGILIEKEYERGVNEKEIKELTRNIEEKGIEQAITDEAELNFLREQAIKSMLKKENPYFKELLSLKTKFFTRINAFIRLGIVKNSKEAINNPMIQEKIKEIIKEWQEQFPGNKREIDLRLWLLRYGKNLIPEGLSINS